MLLRPRSGTEPEVLLIHRPESMAFAAGIHAFPGGKVDPEDGSESTAAEAAFAAEAADRLGGNVSASEALALHRAAIRELDEEASIRLPVDALVPIAQWTTPAFMTRRFATWFFVADLPPDADPVFAPEEVAAHRWVTPSAAFDQLAAGEIGIWVPTTGVLERLLEARASSAAEVGERIQFGRVGPPRVVDESPTLVSLAFSSAGGLPGRSIETTIHGRRDLVVVDPGDATEDAIRTIDAAAERRGATIRAVVLTAPDPDHAAGAEAIAIPHEVPVLVAPGAGARLPYATREVHDGEPLPGDVPLVVRLGPAGSGRLEVVRG